jgi:hypothetical protein
MRRNHGRRDVAPSPRVFLDLRAQEKDRLAAVSPKSDRVF